MDSRPDQTHPLRIYDSDDYLLHKFFLFVRQNFGNNLNN